MESSKCPLTQQRYDCNEAETGLKDMGMKTIQEVIRDIDPEEIAKSYCYEYPIKIDGLDEIPDDITVGELKQRRINRLKGFIQSLLELTPKPDRDREKILFLTKASPDEPSEGEGIYLVYSDELLSTESFDYEKFSCYSFDFTPRDEAMAFLVAENKYTQDHLHTLVVRFIRGLTIFGFEWEDVKAVEDEILESADQINREECLTVDEVFEDLQKTFGMPEREIYPREDELRHKKLEAEVDYCQYLRAVELERIRDYLQNNE